MGVCTVKSQLNYDSSFELFPQQLIILTSITGTHPERNYLYAHPGKKNRKKSPGMASKMETVLKERRRKLFPL